MTNKKRNFNRLFNKDFIMLVTGNGVSAIGTFIYGTAIILILKELTDSATLIGLNSTMAVLPAIFFGLISGSITDNFNRKYILVITDSLRGLSMLFLAFVGFFEKTGISEIVISDFTIHLPDINLQIWMIFVVTLFMGINDVLFTPAARSILPNLVPKDKIMNGNSMMQSVFQIAQVIGQPLGGILFVLTGSTFIFFLNGFSYLASAISEMFIHLPYVKRNKSKSVSFLLKETIEGIKYTRSVQGLKSLLLLLVFTNCLFPPFLLSLPYYVEDILNLSNIYFGYFLGSMGFGAILGSIIFTFLKITNNTRFYILLFSITGIGVTVFLLALKPETYFIFIIFALLGCFNMIFNIILNSAFLEKISPDFRGRFYGLFHTSVVLATPLSYFISGVVLDITDKNVIIIFGVIAIITFSISFLMFTKNIKTFFLKTIEV